jgi:hypothetical protein
MAHRSRQSTAWVKTLGIVLAAFMGAGVARAQVPLNVGDSVVPPTITPGSPPFGDTFVAEDSSVLFQTNGTETIDGSFVSAVYRNTLGTLDFFYQVQLNSGTIEVDVDNTSIVTFSGVPDVEVAQTQTSIGDLFLTGSAGGAYSDANRPFSSGINTTYLSGVGADQNSFILIVRTGALTFTNTGSADVSGGGIGTNSLPDTTLAPVAVAFTPEPGSLPLLSAACVLFAAGRFMLPSRRRLGVVRNSA